MVPLLWQYVPMHRIRSTPQKQQREAQTFTRLGL
jgi:hypothetical protein